MAQTGKKTASSTRTRKPASQNKARKPQSVKASSSSAAKAKKRDEVEVGFGDYWHAFTKTKVFVPIMVIVVTAFLVGLDLLIAWNSFHRFFLFLGIELIVAAVIWLIIMIYSLGSEKKTSVSDSEAQDRGY